jgi:PAS domain S-box-containing protein
LPAEEGSTVDSLSSLSGPADAVDSDVALDDLLRQIIGGFFVLTDGHGAVSKWGDPAALVFGLAGEDVIGRSLFETAVDAAPDGAADRWRRVLESGESPSAPGRVQASGRHGDERFALELVFVPVRLDEGFDFSLFLEDLALELPLNLMLMRMRRQHPVVVRALRAALDEAAPPRDSARAAGTLVVLRPLVETPWVQEELSRRAAARAASDAEIEERIRSQDPGIQGGSFGDLEDAAAIVARVLDAFERIELLERTTNAMPDLLADARYEADLARTRADVAGETAAAALERCAAGDRRLAETGARLDALTGSVEWVEAELAPAVAELRAGLDAVRAQLDEYRTGFEEARQAALGARREAEQARRALEEQRDSRSDVADAMNQILGMAVQQRRGAGAGEEAWVPARRPLRLTGEDGGRPPRPGFDDAGRPLAMLGLDGRFQALNPAFARLVGYSEPEFAKAMWPSVHDRGVYAQQCEQLEKLARGELETVEVRSSFLHGQGLMVLVCGRISLVRDSSGAPSHLLLEADER